jgi:hypothetical protein
VPLDVVYVLLNDWIKMIDWCWFDVDDDVIVFVFFILVNFIHFKWVLS